MKRFAFKWLYRLSWLPAAVGILLIIPMCILENAIPPQDRGQ